MPVIDINKDLSALFHDQVRATPDLVALEDDSKTLTYADLERETSALADRLRHYGVGRDKLVGVLLGRSADYMIACLAALRAGGAFLVLELAYPPGLLADVIEDARPTVVITHRAHAGQLKSEAPLIILDEPEANTNGAAPRNSTAKESLPLPADDDLDRLAFVSYSSGTTGKPKGIANPHRAPVLSYDLRFRLSDLRPGDRVACNVFFIWEILRPLLRGATVVAVPDEASYDPLALVDLLANRRITETLMTPTLLTTILSRHSKLDSRLPDLRTLWLNGEVVTTDLVQRTLKALPKTRLLNCYSASETHEIACGDCQEMISAEATVCPVGPPMDPNHTYILGEDGRKVQPGVSGELVVGGSLLARGYLNLPDTTSKAFLPDAFDQTSGARMYRTGDTARILPSGLLEITGRVGAMIKLRGYSIQPGAVENTVVKHLSVQHCAVVAHGDGLERQLVAYFVRDNEPAGRTVLSVEDSGYSPVARRALADHLAHYMIPALWIQMDELPTHEVSGKVDLKALPDPMMLLRKTNGVKKQKEKDTSIKVEQIAKIWAASLNLSVRSVTQEHDFFDLGGHSLALADLARRLTEGFGFPVPLARLAGNPTLEGHLEVVRSARDGHVAAVQADLPAFLRADSALPDDIQPRGISMCALSGADTIFLTGVTGYLGAFLLTSILESTSANVVCLVRFAHPSGDARPEGMARLRKNLLDLGIWHDSILDRVEILPGNLGRKHLGLSEGTFEELASRVQVIIHCGATVNLVYPYAAMRSANVGGTREILRLASHSGATVHHISTNGVLPPSTDGWTEDAVIDVEDVPEKLVDGYGQTKWVAEQLVREASRRGMPVKIHRPGTISGHSVLGSTNTYDLLTALFVESIHLGTAPDIDGWLAEMTPVDFVSKAITTLSNHVDGDQLVYHLGDPSPVSASSLLDTLTELGYPTERLGWNDWVALWNQKRGASKAGDDSFTAGILRRGMPTVDFLKAVSVLKDGATQPILSQYGLERPKIDSKLFQTYTRDFYARGWLPRPPRRDQTVKNAVRKEMGPLAGRVAVVTGASSGIGAAVATALARDGAHVALAARRTKPLETLKARLAGNTGKIIVQKTDVTDKTQVEALMRETTEQLGPIDILVSCAGVMYFTMMANVQTDEWERTVDVNCKGLLHCLSSTVPSMLSRGKGHIVSISSDAGRKVFPGLGVYSASKFFVEATLQSLRLETAGTGLRVTSIQPGNTATELLGMSTDAEAIKKFGEPSGARVLDPEDVAEAIAYALRQPEHVAVNEILIEPRDEPI
ncbi:AMP-binding enzyme [Pseudomassariella vexata]|uniref:AMP-binding enzyme n=1 Tax=Pseudomassariella vexata TaxID=1141098 RepID=A0A1Y2E5J1_9PEZI|nr:AMP-binding enzyme [Pseudomassariella vexata]ORY66614.1 AMP-binding enzyme [Pseudomassariella vexata]